MKWAENRAEINFLEEGPKKPRFLQNSSLDLATIQKDEFTTLITIKITFVNLIYSKER